MIDREDGRSGFIEAAYTLELTSKRYRLIKERCAAKGHPPHYVIEEVRKLAGRYARLPNGSYHTDGVVWWFR